MKITKDTQTMEDPNEFGEELRDYIFVEDKYGGDLGCYSTFDVRPEFTREECPKRIAEILMGAPSEWNPVKEWEEDRKKHCAYWTCGPLFVAWFWDGDGTLYIQEGSRAAINIDCKKTYGWEWVKLKEKAG